MVRSRGVKGARRATGVGADAAAMGSGALGAGTTVEREPETGTWRAADTVSLGVEVYRRGRPGRWPVSSV